MTKYFNFVQDKSLILSQNNEKLLELQKHLRQTSGNPNLIVVSTNMRAGLDCTAANECFAFVDKNNKYQIGPETIHECFGALLERRLPHLRNIGSYNSEIIEKSTFKQLIEIFDEILDYADVYRPQAIGGDYKSTEHFKAVMVAAENHPTKTIFGYTKRFDILRMFKNKIPENMAINYSYGGKWDSQIKYNTKITKDVPTTFVITPQLWDIYEDSLIAKSKLPELEGIEVPLQKEKYDDYNFIVNRKSFGILIHGTQSKVTKERLNQKSIEVAPER